VVISSNRFNHGPAGLTFVVPTTTRARARAIPSHVTVDPPEGGLRARSYVKCEDMRSISTERLLERWGWLTAGTMAQIEDRLRILLEL